MCVCNSECFIEWSRQYLISGLNGELLSYNPHTDDVKPLKTKVNKDGYTIVTLKYKDRVCYTGLHRLVWAYHNGVIPENYVIDHIDNNKANNHPSNLRLATQAQNAKNTKNTLTPFRTGLPRNVERMPFDRYRATLICDGVRYKSQPFKYLHEAVQAAQILRKQLYGEWAFDWESD